MKKLLFVLLSGLIVVCIGFVLYSEKYTVINDKKQLEDNIIRFINRPSIVANNIDIKQELNLDNKKYVLFVINNSLGKAELTKGFNNKYKIETTEYGSVFYTDEINRTNKGKYFIILGKNYEDKIAYIKILLDAKEYKISIPKQEYFIVNCAVPIETQQEFVGGNSIKFYSNNDIDITEDMSKVLFR